MEYLPFSSFYQLKPNISKVNPHLTLYFDLVWKQVCLTTENIICGLTKVWSQNLSVGTERTHTHNRKWKSKYSMSQLRFEPGSTPPAPKSMSITISWNCLVYVTLSALLPCTILLFCKSVTHQLLWLCHTIVSEWRHNYGKSR